MYYKIFDFVQFKGLFIGASFAYNESSIKLLPNKIYGIEKGVSSHGSQAAK